MAGSKVGNPWVDDVEDAPIVHCPEGLQQSVRELVPLYYEELKRVARIQRGKLAPFSTLNTTAIVHESYLRLLQQARFASRGHFLRASSIAMRHLIVDHVRARVAKKRGSGQSAESFDGQTDATLEFDQPERILAVHQALDKLARRSPRLADIAVCKYFADYTDGDIAEALEISERTVQRDWALARAWLTKTLRDA